MKQTQNNTTNMIFYEGIMIYKINVNRPVRYQIKINAVHEQLVIYKIELYYY